MENGSRRARAVYTVVEKGDGKNIWVRIGGSFENRDGSETVLLDAMPFNGKLVIREYQPRDGTAARPSEGARPL